MERAEEEALSLLWRDDKYSFASVSEVWKAFDEGEDALPAVKGVRAQSLQLRHHQLTFQLTFSSPSVHLQLTFNSPSTHLQLTFQLTFS